MNPRTNERTNEWMKERRTWRVNRIIATERLSEISSASFQTESVDFSRGSLQFSNGFSWKLLFHLSFNRNARRLWRPVLQIEEGTYWGQSTNENYTLSLFQKKNIEQHPVDQSARISGKVTCRIQTKLEVAHFHRKLHWKILCCFRN